MNKACGKKTKTHTHKKNHSSFKVFILISSVGWTKHFLRWLVHLSFLAWHISPSFFCTSARQTGQQPLAETLVVMRTFSLPSRKRLIMAARCSICSSPVSSATACESLVIFSANQAAVLRFWNIQSTCT